MKDGMIRLQQMQERILTVIREQVQQWLDDLMADAFNPNSFLRFITNLGIDLSQIPGMVGKENGFDPYRLLGLERTASDEKVKKRYREFLMKLHPDTAGIQGTDFLLQMVMAAYQQIAEERGCQ